MSYLAADCPRIIILRDAPDEDDEFERIEGLVIIYVGGVHFIAVDSLVC